MRTGSSGFSGIILDRHWEGNTMPTMKFYNDFRIDRSDKTLTLNQLENQIAFGERYTNEVKDIYTKLSGKIAEDEELFLSVFSDFVKAGSSETRQRMKLIFQNI